MARKEANNLQFENILDTNESSTKNETVKNIDSGKNKLKEKVENVSNFTPILKLLFSTHK